MKANRIKAVLLSVTMLATCAAGITPSASADAGTYDSTITVDMNGGTKEISQYIYGVNDGCELDDVTATCVRGGGNRMTGYNWENNYSNAGSDWKNSSDTNISDSTTPGMAAIKLSNKATKYNIPYKFTTLQMAGYVSADKNGTVLESEVAPSSRWNEVLFRKDSELSLEPDLTDGKVYMDEYVNYIIQTLGDSSTSTGMQGYSLDNEPALWNDTHSLLHPEEVTMDEITTKSVELASVIKELDPNADVFGPALWGYLAYKQLGDSDTSDEWETIKASGNYNWFIDYYLDTLKKASDEKGTRLLDYLDIHYYNQAKSTDDDILQSPRTLWDETFAENSWIGESWFASDRPFFKHIFNAIDTYYPGTKLAISEYNFEGGATIAGGVAEVDGLGVFATNGVSMATLWDTASGSIYPYLGINLYTNYDGNGSDFGDTLLTDTTTTDYTKSTAYASVHSDDDSTVDVIITNKDTSNDEEATINLENTSKQYKSGVVYGITDEAKEIIVLDTISEDEITNGNSVKVELPSVSAVHVVLSTDADAYDDVSIYEPTEAPTYETTVITDRKTTTNGFSFEVENPNDVEKIVIGCSSSVANGSAYWGGGGGLCFTIDTDSSKNQWASKSFSYTNSSKEIEIPFDGTFTVPTTAADGSDSSEEMSGTIVSNSIEVQTWWDYAEKDGDTVSINYDTITVYYKDKTKTETTIATEATEATETTVADTTEAVETTEPATEATEVATTVEETTAEATTEKSAETVAVDTSIMYGDVNCDGNVTISDVVLLNKFLVNSASLNDLQLKCSDCNLDGVQDSKDSLIILKHLVGTYAELPVTE